MKTLIPALALSALLLVGCGSEDSPSDAASETGSAPGVPTTEQATSESTPTASEEATTDPGATATSEPVDPQGTAPEGLLPMDDPAYSGEGETVTFDDGATATVADRSLEIVADGKTFSGNLPADAEGGVGQYPVEFAQAGTGYLVQQSGGEFSDLSVAFALYGEVVVATEPEDVPFGYEGNEVDGTLVETWTTGEGQQLVTRVRVGAGESLSENEYRVYSWEARVRADDDGGGIVLEPTDLGIVCFDDDAGTYEAC